MLAVIFDSSMPSKIPQQKDYPLNLHQPPASGILEASKWKRGAGEVSFQKKSPLLAIKYHLSCTEPEGISWVLKGHGL